MDELLAKRYEALFNSYGAGGGNVLFRTKILLAQHVREGQLRHDAALFLLTNLDYMVIRPYTGYLPNPTASAGEPLAEPSRPSWKGGASRDVYDVVAEAVHDIVRALHDRPASATTVFMMAAKNWDRLAPVFGWAG